MIDFVRKFVSLGFMILVSGLISITMAQDPDIAVSPQSVVFEPITVSSSTSLGIEIVNGDEGNLDIQNMEIVGDDAAMFALVPRELPFTVPPFDIDDATMLTFSPTTGGTKNAFLRITSNDPDEGVLDVPLLGRAVFPVIEVGTAVLDFGEVSHLTPRTLNVSVTNAGEGDLAVDTFFIGGLNPESFRIEEGRPPFTLSPQETIQMAVLFSPRIRGEQSATLSLFSNDPDNPSILIEFTGVGLLPQIELPQRLINYGEVIPGFEKVLPVTISNAGQSDLLIQSLLIQGKDSLDFVLEAIQIPSTIIPGESLEVLVRFIADVVGEREAELWIESDDLTNGTEVVGLIGTTSTLQVDVGDSVFGDNIEMSIGLPPNFSTKTVQIFYRRPEARDYREAVITGSGSNFIGNIPAEGVGIEGILYYAVVSDSVSVVTIPANEPQDNPLFLPIRISQLDLPVELTPWTYKLMSIPLNLDNKRLDSLFVDDYGPYNIRRWRVFRWEDGAYAEFENIQTPISEGIGFWLVTNDAASFDLDNAVSSDLLNPYQYELQPGWNQIGNPYSFPVFWPEGTTDPRIELPVSYDGTQFVYENLFLNPWEGYFVFNSADIPLPLSLSPLPSDLGKRSSSSQEPSFQVSFTARTTNHSAIDSNTRVGFAEGATPGHDSFDISKAPPIGNYIQLSIFEDDKRYAGNFKPLSEEGAYWDLELTGTYENEPVEVSLSSIGKRPEGYQISLIDLDSGEFIPLHDSSFVITTGNKGTTKRFRAIVATPAFADDLSENMPSNMLGPNYPNPFSGSTTIQYAIEEAGFVELSIYNVLGQHIMTLVHEEKEAGKYSIPWRGENTKGVSLANGIYFYTLKIADFSQTRKMLLIK